MRRTGFVLPLEHPSRTKYVNSTQLQRFLVKNDKSPIRLFQCFCFPDLQEVAFGAWLLIQLLQPLLLVEVRALYYSPLSLTIFFDFFRLAVADKNGHDPSFLRRHLNLGRGGTPYNGLYGEAPCDLFRDKLPQNDRTCQLVALMLMMQCSSGKLFPIAFQTTTCQSV